jgi:hypothetical protein
MGVNSAVREVIVYDLAEDYTLDIWLHLTKSDVCLYTSFADILIYVQAKADCHNTCKFTFKSEADFMAKTSNKNGEVINA